MENITILKQNVVKLVEQIEKLKTQNRLLEARAVAAESRAENLENKAKELQEQLSSSLLSSAITEVAGGTKSAKARVDRLIKDIDKCIALSSK